MIKNACISYEDAVLLTGLHGFFSHTILFAKPGSTFLINIEQRRLILTDKSQRRAKYLLTCDDVLALCLIPVEARQAFVESVGSTLSPSDS